MATQVAMEVRDMVDIYVTGRKQITNIYVKIDDSTRDLLDSYIKVRQDVVIEDSSLKVSNEPQPGYELSLDLTLEDSNEKVLISNCSNKCPGDIIVGIRCLNGVTRITKGDGGLKIPAKTLCSPTHFKLGTKEVLKFSGTLRIASTSPNGKIFSGQFSIFTKSSYKKRKETVMTDSWGIGLEKKGLVDGQKKKRQRHGTSPESPLQSPKSSPNGAAPMTQHQLYSKTIPVFTSKAVIVPATGPHHAHSQVEIRGFNSGGGTVNLLWKEGDNIMIIEPIDNPTESKLVFSTPYGRPGLVIEIWIRVDGSYFIGDTQGNPFKFTFDSTPDPALNEVLKIVQNLEKSVSQLSEGRPQSANSALTSSPIALRGDDSVSAPISDLEKQMDEMKRKTSQLVQYGTFMSEKEDKDSSMKDAPRMQTNVMMTVPLAVPLQPPQVDISAIPEPIVLNLDDIITLEVKPSVKNVRFININVTDEVKDLCETSAGQPPLIQLDESLLEPGTKHINIPADYKFSMTIHRDNETEELEVNRCVEPNCEGRLLKRRVVSVPCLENIIRMAKRGPKLQIPLLFYCSALHFNGNKFTVKVQLVSQKPFKPSFLGIFSVWTTEKYLSVQRAAEASASLTPVSVPLVPEMVPIPDAPEQGMEIDKPVVETNNLIIAQ